MQFKTKDLLVTVLPRAEISAELAKVCALHTLICINPTLCPHHTLCAQPSLCHQPSFCGPCSWQISCLGCSIHFTAGCGVLNSCGPGRSACDPTIFCPGGSREPWYIEHLEDLVTLRADLKETIAQLDRIEKGGGLTSSVRTKADAETLEAGLTEALENVRAAKKGLK